MNESLFTPDSRYCFGTFPIYFSLVNDAPNQVLATSEPLELFSLER